MTRSGAAGTGVSRSKPARPIAARSIPYVRNRAGTARRSKKRAIRARNGRKRRMARKPTLSPSEAMELRLMRESGVSVKDAAGLAGVSETTALRVLKKLRQKLGPERFKGHLEHQSRQRARAHTFVNNAT